MVCFSRAMQATQKPVAVPAPAAVDQENIRPAVKADAASATATTTAPAPAAATEKKKRDRPKEVKCPRIVTEHFKDETVGGEGGLTSIHTSTVVTHLNSALFQGRLSPTDS